MLFEISSEKRLLLFEMAEQGLEKIQKYGSI